MKVDNQCTDGGGQAMPNNKTRPVLLVGSVPLESSTAVFEVVAASLGGIVKRIPDGEVGERTQWIMWQANVLKSAKGLEPGSSREIAPGYSIALYRIPSGEKAASVEFGPLGYASAAIESYEGFKRLRAEGRIPNGVRFQVSLPTSFAVGMQFIEPEFVGSVWPRYQARLNEEIAEIVNSIPHQDLAIQWDICVEIVVVLENPTMATQIPLEQLTGSIARLSQLVPVEVELGLHLCYGDPGHKHMVDPKDTSIMVQLANDLAATVERPITWVHMPVPRDRDDAAYFAPLRNLKLAPRTELYLGLVHLTDGIDGALRRLSAARNVVEDFGIATECGFGRRPSESIPALLQLHRQIAEIA
jgi:hypothetical protein